MARRGARILPKVGVAAGSDQALALQATEVRMRRRATKASGSASAAEASRRTLASERSRKRRQGNVTMDGPRATRRVGAEASPSQGWFLVLCL